MNSILVVHLFFLLALVALVEFTSVAPRDRELGRIAYLAYGALLAVIFTSIHLLT